MDPISSDNKETIIAIKTFSDGVSLPATDINTYLTNSGLVYVKSQTVGNNVASVEVTGAFSSTYDNYRIIMTGGTQNANNAVYLRLGSSVSDYYGTLIFSAVGGASVLQASDNNSGQMNWVGGGIGGQYCHASCDVFAPFLAQYTKVRNGQYQNNNNYGTQNGEHRVATSYTSFTLGLDSGNTISGGTITVYGYRKA